MKYLKKDLLAQLDENLNESENKAEFLQSLREYIHNNSGLKHNPVDRVIWVPAERVQGNDYNPNQVATNEMQLLYTSIKHDGYTQPIVTVYDEDIDKYVVIDGFHRYKVGQTFKDIKEGNKNMLPIVVLDKTMNERMASTIRHNRARGKHSVQGMSHLVFELLSNGLSDAEIMQELGMESEELLRLKHITGFSKLFKDVEYNRAWETDKQIKLSKEWQRENLQESGYSK